ncbi:hypothetical protein F5Y16DRAFT_403922 [Xylariaceae sp. FL0255]|nr:hypothetical protein F5Y16DRAFT_403922 [Xylariaceae sp. FL0255]
MLEPRASTPAVTGEFAWLAKIGATPEAVATLNDQPYVFFTLIAALVVCILEGLFIWFIHYATLKPEQKKKKTKDDGKKGGKGGDAKGGKPPAQRKSFEDGIS